MEVSREAGSHANRQCMRILHGPVRSLGPELLSWLWHLAPLYYCSEHSPNASCVEWLIIEAFERSVRKVHKMRPLIAAAVLSSVGSNMSA